MASGRPSGGFADFSDDGKLAGYAPEKIYSRSKDEYGHGADAKYKYPTGFEPLIIRLVEDKRITEYRSVQDFCRDAMAHRLRYWYQKLDEPQGVASLDGYLALIELNKIKLIREETKNGIEAITNALRATKQEPGSLNMVLDVAIRFRDGLSENSDVEEMDALIARYS